MFDNFGYGGDPAGIDRQREELRAIAGGLGALRAPTEPVFLGLGEALAEALAVLQHLEADFDALAHDLQADQAASAAEALRQGVGRSAELAVEAKAAMAFLRRLEADAAAGVRPLTVLSRVVAEVRALAINARIEAAQVRAGDTDFTVFTTEIARLGCLAGNTVGAAAQRLDALRPVIAQAILAEEKFESTDARELDVVSGRLENSLDELLRHQRQASEAASVVAQRSRRIAERVAACVVGLQINDLTSQRIEHVRDAIVLLDTLLDGQDLDEGRKQALVASVCRLQARQLASAARDFGSAAGRLKTNMKALAGDAEGILAEAEGMIGGNGSTTSFVGDLRDNVGRAAMLLSAYGVAEGRIQDLIGTVSTGFAAMEQDFVGIHAIDTDMRIMGLNASLKCARLGPEGRALGVVAQELRECSHRTEETIRAVSGTIAAAVKEASTLSECARHEHDDAGALAASMETSLEALCGLGGIVEAALARLVEACGHASSLLADTAAGIAIDSELPAAAAEVTARLTAIADGTGTDADPAQMEAIRGDVLRLLGDRYTMASERMVHDLFAEDGAEEPLTATAESENGGGDIDDCFL